jgi:hypothetical protein
MVNTYKLVNPYIEGELKTNVKADNSLKAAKNIYKKLSEHFNNSVPSFHFSIQKGGSDGGKLYHFEVKEKRNNDEVSFTVKPMTIKGIDEAESRFKVKLSDVKERLKQDGGKKHKKSKKSKKHDSDSDSDFDSSSSDYKKSNSYVSQPIYYWWYDPYVYRIDSVYVPTLYSYLTPRIEYSLLL